MKNTVVISLLVFQLISVCTGVNPCIDYIFIDMADGLRSSDFDSRDSAVSICDAFLEPETWYRFEHDSGDRLLERPAEPEYCGTTAPIWMNGTHPTDKSEVRAGVCATYSSENNCGWRGTVRIRLCNESGSEYFVYLLAVPPGCPLAYCIDAASRKQCIPPLVWLEEQFRCGVSETTAGYSTVPPTTLTTPTESPRLTPTLSTSTEPENSDWSRWGRWSVCSKPCDYGFQSRKRTCSQLPCEGPANIYRLCNEYSCQTLHEERTKGIGLVLQYSASNEDTLLTIVKNQPKINNIIRRSINDICPQYVSMCCAWSDNLVPALHQEFVLSSNIYTAQGSPKPRSDDTVYYQVIAVINEDLDRAICGHSHRIHPRHEIMESSPKFLSLDIMTMASVNAADDIFKETGLILRAYVDPASMNEDGDYVHDEESCPSLTCVLPIVLCITLLFVALVIGCSCLANFSFNHKVLPYTATILSLKESDKAIQQEPIDFQKIDLSVLQHDC